MHVIHRTTTRDLYGVLESPEFPLYYPNNKNCIYDIEVPSDNYTIKITCDAFTIQVNLDVVYHTVYIQDSPTFLEERTFSFSRV